MNKLKQLSSKDLFFLGMIGITAYDFLIKPLFSSINYCWKTVLCPRYNLKQRYGGGDNSWAVVTGATAGIGLQYVNQFAQNGFNVVLIGRNAQKLNDTKNFLSKKYQQRQFEVRQLDLTSTNSEDYYRLVESISNLDVSILVNNAGWARVTPFQKLDIAEVQTQMNLNTYHYIYLTRYILPQMMKRKPRSAIIFVSATGSDIPLPYLSVYCATKRFECQFGRSIHEQVKRKVDVQVMKPMGVSTRLFPGKPGGISIISTQECINASLNKLGKDIETRGHWKHQMNYGRLVLISKLISERMFMKGSAKKMKQFFDRKKN